jgi:glyoxylase-like metal-dependent hydrolase (beta-lactamase superfamily II)
MRAPDFVTGGIQAWLVDDGFAAYHVGGVFPELDPAMPELAAVLTEEGGVPMSHHCLLVRTGDRLVLVDTGYGELAGADAETGKLVDRLGELGVRPEEVDTVVISHAHGDHVGGLLRDGQPVFGRARHLVPRPEWDHWTGPGAEAGTGKTVARFLRPLHDQGLVDLIDDGAQVAPGVVVRDAPGHTPGHVVVDLADGGDRAVYMSDAILHAVHVAHPEWACSFDNDGGLALDTRRRLLAEVADKDILVGASHVGTTGHVRGTAGAYRWDATAPART